MIIADAAWTVCWPAVWFVFGICVGVIIGAVGVVLFVALKLAPMTRAR